MKKQGIWSFGLAMALALCLALAGCGGGGGGDAGAGAGAANSDTDGDGIPNAVDAFPNDPAKFVNNVTVPLVSPTIAAFSTAVTVNTSSKMVGYAENPTTGIIAAKRWGVNPADGSVSESATLDPIAGAGNTYSAAYGINDPGIAVGESENGANTIVAAMWPAGSTVASALSLTGLAAPAAAYSINTAGQIAGEATLGGALRAVIWNSGSATPVNLGILAGGTYSTAYSINSDGLVVGEADNAAGATHAVAWRVNAGGQKSLGPVDLGVITVGDVRSIAFGCDDSDRIVGESESLAGVVHAGLWNINSSTLLPSTKADLGANASANSINPSQNRIVGHEVGTANPLATVWDARNTGLPNSAVVEPAFSQAIGVNDGGLIVGVQGNHAFAAVPK